MYSNRKPTQKIVTPLMRFVGCQNGNVRDKSSETIDIKHFFKYECPRTGCTRGTIKFATTSGFTNPHVHLNACYRHGLASSEQFDKLEEMYCKALEEKEKRGGTIRSNFNMEALSMFDKAVNGYLRLIMYKSVPLSCVEDNEFRRLCKFDVIIRRKLITNVIYKLSEALEKKLATELRNSRRTVLYDGWTENGVQFVAMFASYIWPTIGRSNHQFVQRPSSQYLMLGVVPMGIVPDDDQDEAADSEKTSKFNAESHLKFFSQCFRCLRM